MKKYLGLFLCVLLLAGVLAGCGNNAEKAPAPSETETTKLVVGATAQPHAEILEQVVPVLAKDGIELEVKVFTDYVQLNPALQEGQIDANFFQHVPYLEDYNANNNTELVWTVKVHTEPMGVYSKKITDITKLADGATVGIPNDATNGGRALAVLEKAGIIKLKEGAGITATDADIVENPKNVKITMMDAAMLPRTLDDADICVINSNYALEADLNPVNDSIFMEDKDSPFANVIAVKSENKDNEAIKKLGAALQTPEIKKFIEDTYQGACVPAF
ncbi:MAG TPA: MetQ/NlpA family ABC transporter substrate-binding protein [Syntrophomonadaceae bacterium]|nr:MetQ/NlpA family ABC transporter substrate-binding protein [Syntrophomonadaceae bacterium]HRX20380.1 MetQ/NlpA family ABC transporter substrate-binding protein [Syntrophomonadaceae bacterium]